MPNAGTHAKIGAAAGAIAYICMCRLYDHPLDLVELSICILASTAAAALPDILEPALTPNHRSVAHSVATLTLVVGVLAEHLCTDHERVESFRKILLACLGAGYITHLVADSRTPSGLPVFC